MDRRKKGTSFGRFTSWMSNGSKRACRNTWPNSCGTASASPRCKSFTACFPPTRNLSEKRDERLPHTNALHESPPREREAEGSRNMRIIGVDRGLAIVGYGFLDEGHGRIRPVHYGCIRTEADRPVAERLEKIYHEVTELLDEYRPDCMAMEELFFNRNVTTAFTVG